MPINSLADIERRLRRLEMEADQGRHKILAPDRKTTEAPSLRVKESPGAWMDYGADLDPVGWASFTVEKGYYTKVGKLVFVMAEIRGESNRTSAYFNLPVTAETSAGFIDAHAYIVDNGTADVDPGYVVLASATQVRVYRDASGAAFTDSGNKRVHTQFFYRAA